MKIKPRTYYKEFYDKDKYAILYTGTKWVYCRASKYNGKLIKYDNRIKWETIKELQDYINSSDYKLEEISKEDLFLELL